MIHLARFERRFSFRSVEHPHSAVWTEPGSRHDVPRLADGEEVYPPDLPSCSIVRQSGSEGER